MRILVLAPHPLLVDRGTPIDVDLLLRALSRRGEEVDVVTYRSGRDVNYANVTIHRVRSPRWLDTTSPGFSIRKVLCDVFLLVTSWRLIATRRFDVVHAGEEAVFIALFFKFFHGIPYVYDMDSSIAQQMVDSIQWIAPMAGILNWFESLAVRHSLAAAPVCYALEDLAWKRGARHVVTLHDISQLEPIDPADREDFRARLETDGVIGLYVGNLERYQGIDLLLRSFQLARKQSDKLELVVVGGSAKAIRKYARQAEALGIGSHTHFVGPLPASRLGHLLAGADFLICPRTKGINTPMKIFPYLHSGRPVLATALPTHTQILDNSVALLAPDQPEGFAAAMVRLANDPGLRDKLGAAGRKFAAENHTYEAHQRRVNSLYEYLARNLDAPVEGAFRVSPKRHKEEVD